MESIDRVSPTQTEDTEFLRRLESLLLQEEATLAELENLVTEEQAVLAGPDPRALLDLSQRIEEALGRLGLSEAAWARLAAPWAADAGGPPGISLITATRAMDPSASAPLWSIRHRVLGAVARIAEGSEANGHLIAGLARTAGAAIDRFTQLQETAASDRQSLRDKSESGKSAPTLDVKA